ncbi:hypothetical protein G6011_11421 [Alternaria panax]|uniref:Uncharacterized protein n=1 Tax=Alternaria panax TaxID=48097 RepID=A0AAD4IDD3_9PLEO|nr:hypothetical protein G6011_11421 [Alternaria panax]
MAKGISFCAKYGKNVHEVCIEAWKRLSATGLDRESAPSCPICRAGWKNDLLLKHLDMEAELNAEAVQVYLDWLYTSTLNTSSMIPRKPGNSSLVTFKLWAVANAVNDLVFKARVVAIYFKEIRTASGRDSIKWDFVERKCDDDIRDFIIDRVLTIIEPGWFKNRSKLWPDVFVSELAYGAMVRWGDSKEEDTRMFKEIWMEKLGVEEDILGDEEFSVPLSGSKG